jgi:hypothetical protein
VVAGGPLLLREPDDAPAAAGATAGRAVLADRTMLRLAAPLLFGGVLLAAVAGLFHPAHEQANDHPAVFAEYARSAQWSAIHLGQFAGMVVVSAGLLALFVALNVRAGLPGWAGRFGAAAAVAALALYGVLQAVDGVALKHAVDAWASAPDAEKAVRFANAETIRWLEWAARSYHSVVFGLALLLYATAIVATARLPRPIGYLMGLSGLAYLVHGWLVGDEGFSPANGIPTLLSIVLVVAWSSWLCVSAWRMPEPGDAGADEPSPPGATRQQRPRGGEAARA